MSSRANGGVATAIDISGCTAIVALSFAMSSAAIRGGEREKHVIENYARYLSSVSQAEFTFAFRDRVAEKDEVFMNSLEQHWVIDFEGERLWRKTLVRRGVTQEGSTLGGLREYHEASISRAAALEVTVDPKTNSAMSVTSYVSVPQDHWEKKNGLLYACYPFGRVYFNGELRFIPDLLNVGSARVVETGASLQISCREAGYHLMVEIDAEKGAHKKVEFGQDVDAGQMSVVYEVSEFTRSEDVWYPAKFDCRISRPVQKHKLPPNIKVVDGRATITTENRDQDDNGVVETPAVTLVAEAEMSNLKCGRNGDQDFVIRAEIPEGLAVSMQDALHLDFVWHDGNVVPKAGIMPSILANERFSGGRKVGRMTLVLANACVFALLAGYFWIRRMRRRS